MNGKNVIGVVLVLSLFLFLISCTGTGGGVILAPSVPEGLSPDDLDDLQDTDTVILLWSESTDPQDYAIHYVIAFHAGDEGESVEQFYTTPATSLEITQKDLFGTLEADTRYSWSVKAVNAKDVGSEFSEAASFKTE